MDKPELSDFGLTEELLKKNKQQRAEYDRRKKEEQEKDNSQMRLWFVIAFAVTIATLIAVCAGYDEYFLGFFLCSVLVTIILFIPFVKSFSSKQDEIYIIQGVIDKGLDSAVKKYVEAVAEYERNLPRINEYSLVKAELLVPSLNEENYRSLGERWIVFSNVYLSNSRSFPNIEASMCADKNFKIIYAKLVEKVKGKVPKFKKELGIFPEDTVEFYYPCSAMLATMKNRCKGDVVTVNGCVPYRIIEVINPSND